MSEFRIQPVLSPDEDYVVVEVWWGEDLVYWIVNRSGKWQIQIFPSPTGDPWTFDADAFMQTLARAKAETDR